DLGHGAGDAGDGSGGLGALGSGRGRLWGSHRSWARHWGGESGTVSGHLPPETIQRIVRANFGTFRGCYKAGLAKNPSLEGRVVTKFVIDRAGSVRTAENDGSDLPDASVTACIVRAFTGLVFPEPGYAGIVTVIYPLTLVPED